MQEFFVEFGFLAAVAILGGLPIAALFGALIWLAGKMRGMRGLMTAYAFEVILLTIGIYYLSTQIGKPPEASLNGEHGAQLTFGIWRAAMVGAALINGIAVLAAHLRTRAAQHETMG